MRSMPFAAFCLLALGAPTLPSVAHAHIKMLKPASWVMTDSMGDPQKQGPCGTASAAPAELTNAITTFKAGEEITVEWTETVDHPGHYRIALAKDRAELADPDLKPPTGSCDYPAGSVPTEPHGNVLLDNIFPTTSYGGTHNYSQKVKLPNEPCEKCTLQLIQWMTKHPPSCLYYQCADIKIVAADSGAVGAAGSAAGSGAAGDAAGSSAAGTAAGTTSSAAGAGAAGTSTVAGQPSSGPGAPAAGKQASAGTTETMGSTAAAGIGAGASAADPATTNNSGCSVTQPGGSATSPLAWAMFLAGLALLARRMNKRILHRRRSPAAPASLTAGRQAV
jgi:hypothetical protein